MYESPQLAELNASAEFIPRSMRVSRIGLAIGIIGVVFFGANLLLPLLTPSIETPDVTESLLSFGLLAVAGFYAYLVPRPHSVMVLAVLFALMSIHGLIELFLDETSWSVSGEQYVELYNFLFGLAGHAYSLYEFFRFTGAYRKTTPETTHLVEQLIADYGQKSVPISSGVIELQQDNDEDMLNWRMLLDETIALMLAFPGRKRGLRQVVAAYFIQPGNIIIDSETVAERTGTTSAELVLPEEVRLKVEMGSNDMQTLRDWNTGVRKPKSDRIEISSKLNAFLN